ncbi:hypothetical protein PHLGIDRAFT_73449 [Phlebiopsis gigantea 11061_1 CR5-6]|uniref:Uncharacterized protein n=1 Tax=Phlebiopsis gigantea (strain 11061_1 CR5-6) TaxID=745531 RepID=A0A0C3PIS2_PHLG1|nr:hypothetical protein PHLGIDRAFT_73449 [Phlebiopsis gigantea 11061_1 CR5-6]
MDAERQTFRTGNPYEARFGYARAVRRGPFVFVSGTTSVDPACGTAALGDVEPAATMIVGARFVAPEMKVEIEADAVVLG